MTYFILEIHPAYTPPRLTGWHGVLDKRTLKQENRAPIPKYTTFPIADDLQMIFTDLILHPCLMVSKKVRQVIHLYDPALRFEPLVLYHSESKRTQTYYLPQLEELDVITPNSRFNRDRSLLIQAEVDGNQARGKVIFQVANVNQTCILIHLDLAESLLRRQTLGIGLKETDLIYY